MDRLSEQSFDGFRKGFVPTWMRHDREADVFFFRMQFKRLSKDTGQFDRTFADHMNTEDETGRRIGNHFDEPAASFDGRRSIGVKCELRGPERMTGVCRRLFRQADRDNGRKGADDGRIIGNRRISRLSAQMFSGPFCLVDGTCCNSGTGCHIADGINVRTVRLSEWIDGNRSVFC